LYSCGFDGRAEMSGFFFGQVLAVPFCLYIFAVAQAHIEEVALIGGTQPSPKKARAGVLNVLAFFDFPLTVGAMYRLGLRSTELSIYNNF